VVLDQRDDGRGAPVAERPHIDARNLRNRERNDLAAGTSAVCDVEIVKIAPAMPGTY
jgi:hypothetical protein